MVPALTNVRALRRLTNRVQPEAAGQLLELMVVLAHGCARLQPLRLRTRHTRTQVDLHQFRYGGHPATNCTMRSRNPAETERNGTYKVCRYASRLLICC